MTLEQYIDNVDKRFRLGNATELNAGYQPAQKWLKDRKLEFDDILHYQKIIVALTETDRIMKQINEIEI